MEHKGGITARQARAEDVAAIVALEKTVFGPLGTACYGEEYVRAWLEVHPAGLTVAERDGRVVGYQYSQIVDFAFDRLDEFATYDKATDGGYTKRSHCPGGNCLHCVSLCSIEVGAGRALSENAYDLTVRLKLKYTLSQTRLPGLDGYLSGLEDQGVKIPKGFTLNDVALWYALETVRMSGALIWPCLDRRPMLALPSPAKPDPVLSKHLKFPGAGLAGVLPDYMHDPQSRDYAALLVSENTKAQ